MKIKHSRLKEIIKEEILKHKEELLDLEEASPWHDSKGRWTSKDKAETYSFTKGAKVSDDLKKRGKVQGDKVVSKFGMNTGSKEKQCGKLDFKTGEKKPITRSCKDYPKSYHLEEVENDESSQQVYLQNLVKQEVEKAVKELSRQLKQRPCRPNLDDFLRYQQALTAATSAPKK